MRKQAGGYGFLHLVHYTSVIFLHREYLQLFPDENQEYNGRLPTRVGVAQRDPPAHPDSQFWVESLRDLFVAARNISDILIELDSLDSLMNTPFVGFAAFTAASMNMYLAIFQWVFPELSSNAQKRAESDVKFLKRGMTVWPLEQHWYATILRLYEFYKLFHLRGGASLTEIGNSAETFHNFDQSLMAYGGMMPNPDDMDAIITASSDILGRLAIPKAPGDGRATNMPSVHHSSDTYTDFTADHHYDLEPEFWNATAEDFLNSMAETGYNLDPEGDLSLVY
jgi:hypothetical protein